MRELEEILAIGSVLPNPKLWVSLKILYRFNKPFNGHNGFSDGQGRMQVQKFSFASFSFTKEKDVPSRGMSGPKHKKSHLTLLFHKSKFYKKKPFRRMSRLNI